MRRRSAGEWKLLVDSLITEVAVKNKEVIADLTPPLYFGHSPE